MNKSFYCFLLLFIAMSCATKKEKTFSDQVSPDLTKVFNINDKKFEKFKIVVIGPTVNDKAKKDSRSLKDLDHSKKKSASKTKLKNKKNVKVKKIVKNEQSSIKKVISKEEKSIFPENYPEKYKEYDLRSQKFWKAFSPTFSTGEKFVLSLSYLGVTAGHIKIETKKMVTLNNKQTYHFVARLKSATFYKYIYSLDDTVESFISKDDFLPVKYTLAQRESGQIVDDLQLFDHEKHQTFFWYKRLKKGKTKTRHVEAFIPKYFQDSFSSLFFVRGLPLKNGDLYQFPVMTRGKMWLIKMKIAGRENIRIMDNKIRAIKVIAETHFPGVLKKKGDIIFWYSDDADRKLLKFKANIKVGSINGEMIKYSK